LSCGLATARCGGEDPLRQLLSQRLPLADHQNVLTHGICTTWRSFVTKPCSLAFSLFLFLSLVCRSPAIWVRKCSSATRPARLSARTLTWRYYRPSDRCRHRKCPPAPRRGTRPPALLEIHFFADAFLVSPRARAEAMAGTSTGPFHIALQQGLNHVLKGVPFVLMLLHKLCTSSSTSSLTSAQAMQQTNLQVLSGLFIIICCCYLLLFRINNDNNTILLINNNPDHNRMLSGRRKLARPATQVPTWAGGGVVVPSAC
jgi:hypothetical protein